MSTRRSSQPQLTQFRGHFGSVVPKFTSEVKEKVRQSSQRLVASFLLLIVPLTQLVPNVPGFFPASARAASDISETTGVVSDREAADLRGKIVPRFYADFGDAGLITLAEVDNFIRYLDEQRYWAMTRPRRMEFLADHRYRPLINQLLDYEGITYAIPPNASQAVSDLAFAAFATDQEVGAGYKEWLKAVPDFWRKFFGQVAQSHRWKIAAQQQEYFRQLQAAQQAGEDPLTVEPPSEIETLFIVPEGKDNFRNGHPTEFNLLYDLGFPPAWYQSEQNDGPMFRSENKPRLLWTEAELLWLRGGWATAYPSSWIRDDVLKFTESLHDLAQASVGNLAGTIFIKPKTDPETGEINGYVLPGAAGSIIENVAANAALMVATLGLLKVLLAGGQAVARWGQRLVIRIVAWLHNVPVEEVTRQLNDEAQRLLQSGLAFLKKLNPNKNPFRYLRMDEYRALARQFGQFSDVQARFLEDLYVGTLSVKPEYRKATSLVLAYLGGERDAAKLGAFLAEGEPAQISFEELTRLVKGYGEGLPYEDLKFLRQIIPSSSPAVLSAFNDLFVRLETQPSAFISATATQTAALGRFWPQEEHLEKPLVYYLDDFWKWLLKEYPELTGGFYLDYGPELTAAFLTGRNPSPFRPPDIILRHDPRLVADLANRLGIQDGNLGKWLGGQWTRFIMEASEARPLQKYYEELLELLYRGKTFDPRDAVALEAALQEGRLPFEVMPVDQSAGSVPNRFLGLGANGEEALTWVQQRQALSRYGEEELNELVEASLGVTSERLGAGPATRNMRVTATIGRDGRLPTVDELLPGLPESPERVSAMADGLQQVHVYLRLRSRGFRLDAESQDRIASFWGRAFGADYSSAKMSFFERRIQPTIDLFNADKKITDGELLELRTALQGFNGERTEAIGELFRRESIVPRFSLGSSGEISELSLMPKSFWQLFSELDQLPAAESDWLLEHFSFSLKLLSSSSTEARILDRISMDQLIRMAVFHPGELTKRGISLKQLIPAEAYEKIDAAVKNFIQYARAKNLDFSPDVDAALIAYAWRSHRAFLADQTTRKPFDYFGIGSLDDYLVSVNGGRLGSIEIDFLKLFDDTLVNGEPMAFETMLREATRLVRSAAILLEDGITSSMITAERHATLLRAIQDMRVTDELYSNGNRVVGTCRRVPASSCLAPSDRAGHTVPQVKLDRGGIEESAARLNNWDVSEGAVHEFVHTLQGAPSEYSQYSKPILEGITEEQTFTLLQRRLRLSRTQMDDLLIHSGYKGWVKTIRKVKDLLVNHLGMDEQQLEKELFEAFWSADPRAKFNQLILDRLPSPTGRVTDLDIRPWGPSGNPHDWLAQKMKEAGNEGGVHPDINQWIIKISEVLYLTEAFYPSNQIGLLIRPSVNLVGINHWELAV